MYTLIVINLGLRFILLFNLYLFILDIDPGDFCVGYPESSVITLPNNCQHGGSTLLDIGRCSGKNYHIFIHHIYCQQITANYIIAITIL